MALRLFRRRRKGGAPSADFSFASSDFNTLGAFFCNFPSSAGDGSSPGAASVSASGAPAGAAARSPVCSSRPRSFRILSRFLAISMLCEAENFPPASARVEFDNVLAAPGRSARSAARRCTRCCGSRLPSPYHLRARIQSFQAFAAPFPGDPVLPSRQEIRRAAWDRFGSKKKSENVAAADPPPRGSARREARVRRRAHALLDGKTSLTAWPEGCRVGETIKNASTSCVSQKGKSIFFF